MALEDKIKGLSPVEVRSVTVPLTPARRKVFKAIEDSPVDAINALIDLCIVCPVTNKEAEKKNATKKPEARPSRPRQARQPRVTDRPAARRKRQRKQPRRQSPA